MTSNSSTTTDRLPPLHPGEVLLEEYMKPYGLSAIGVAKLVHVPRTRIERLVAEEVSLSADTALRLGKLFGTSAQFWLNLQARYDIETTLPALEGELEGIKEYRQEAA